MQWQRRSERSVRLRAAILAGAALLSGCGSGDGGSSGGSDGTVAVVPGASTPASSPTPSPTPPPISAAEQQEYQRSSAAVAARADAAYRAGATGRGIRIAIIDTGIAPGLGEFASRIDPASRDMVGDRGLVDQNGHGTFMASVALAARDGRGMHGIAPDATLLSFNVSTVGTCTPGDCPARSGPVARAIDAAVAAGARVISMSFTAEQTDDAIVAAVRRAAAAGAVMVISAGNEAAAEPPLLSRAIVEAGTGCVIIAGGHDLAERPYSNGNRAGSGRSAAFYLTALGVDVTMLKVDGSLTTNPGTSPAAAAISAAAALIAQARPNLSPAQIVSVLLNNATDAGAAGRDPVYGNGILNLERSFAALAATG